MDFYIATRVGEFYGTGHKDRVAIISETDYASKMPEIQDMMEKITR